MPILADAPCGRKNEAKYLGRKGNGLFNEKSMMKIDRV